MKHYRCSDIGTDGHPCDCEYRETANGTLEYRYAGELEPWKSNESEWHTDPYVTTLEKVASYGHNLIEIEA